MANKSELLRFLKKLGLPRLLDFKDEFLELAEGRQKKSGGKTRSAGG